jgi:hypothetical protein
MWRRSIAVLVLVSFLPGLALAQESPKAGVVTTLEGSATARRVALPSGVSLKFKDEVFLQDRVTTGDRSLVKMLLGGKALVTVRERSQLIITEVPGRSTIDLESGKVALSIAREKMAPGEVINFRTPNAVAGVRGTVIVGEVLPATSASPIITNFFVLRGTAEASALDPVSRSATGPLQSVGVLQSVTISGVSAPRVAPIRTDEVGQITAGLQAKGERATAGEDEIKVQARQTAIGLVNALMPSTETQSAAIVAGPSTASVPGSGGGESKSQINPSLAVPVPKRIVSVAPGQRLMTLSGDLTVGGGTLINLTNFAIVQAGSNDLIAITPEAVVKLGGPLMTLVDSSVSTGGSLLKVFGSLTSGTLLPFADLDPTEIVTAGDFINISGGKASFAGTFLVDVGGTITTGGNLVGVVNGGALSTTGNSPFVVFDGSTLTAGGDLLNVASATLTSATTGALVELTGSTTTAARLARLTSSSGTTSASLAGALLVTSGGSFTVTGDLVEISGSAASLISTTTAALVQVNGTGAGPFLSAVDLVDVAGTLTLGGPLLAVAANTTLSGAVLRAASATLTSPRAAISSPSPPARSAPPSSSTSAAAPSSPSAAAPPPPSAAAGSSASAPAPGSPSPAPRASPPPAICSASRRAARSPPPPAPRSCKSPAPAPAPCSAPAISSTSPAPSPSAARCSLSPRTPRSAAPSSAPPAPP